MLSGIIGSEGKGEIPSESVQELSQVLGSSSDVIFGVVEIPHIETDCCLWH